MTITDDYYFGTISTMLDNMSDEDAKDIIESLNNEKCIEETKNIF